MKKIITKTEKVTITLLQMRHAFEMVAARKTNKDFSISECQKIIKQGRLIDLVLEALDYKLLFIDRNQLSESLLNEDNMLLGDINESLKSVECDYKDDANGYVYAVTIINYVLDVPLRY